MALVTGATGFVGSHLVEVLLSRGWRVRCLTRRTSDLRWLPVDRVELVAGDVGAGSPAAQAALRDAVRGASTVFHLAAVTSAARDEAYERVNVGGTRRLAEAIAAAAPDALLVFCSSLAAAGPARLGRPLREDDEPAPATAYGRSKLAAERALAASGVRHVVVRPPTVYGPRDVDILAAFRLAARGLAVRLAPPGQRLSLVHARDLAEGMACVAERASGGTWYLTDGEVHRWEEVIAGIGAAVGTRPRVLPLPPVVLHFAAHADRTRARLTGRKPLLTPDRARDLVTPDWTCDDSRARRELGYASRIRLDDGLRETAAWYRAQGWL